MVEKLVKPETKQQDRGGFMIFISEILWKQTWPLNNPLNLLTILSL